MTPWVWLGIGWVLSWATMQTADQPATGEYKKDRGPQAIGQMLYDWRDEQRSRDVPVKIYYPQGEGKALPVIIFSHGLGGSREGYAYLGRHWASYGYVCVHIQHIGSDESVWKGQTQPMESMKKAVAEPQNALNRPLDVHFVLDRLEKLQGEDGPLNGRMDLKRVGMAGHSFGAYTTMAIAGQTFITPAGRSVKADDWRLKVKAGIAMSPTPPTRRDALDAAYASIRIPILMMTGTRDDSPVNDTKAAERRVPFDHLKNAVAYLVTFAGGDHMVFSGRVRLRGAERGRDDRFHDLILMSTTAFWDAYLRDDAAARKWLADGGFEKVMGKDGTFEKKAATRPAP